MDVQLINLQQLCDTNMSRWTKLSEECFGQLVECENKVFTLTKSHY